MDDSDVQFVAKNDAQFDAFIVALKDVVSSASSDAKERLSESIYDGFYDAQQITFAIVEAIEDSR